MRERTLLRWIEQAEARDFVTGALAERPSPAPQIAAEPCWTLRLRGWVVTIARVGDRPSRPRAAVEVIDC